MIILHGPSLIHCIADLSIRALVSQRFSQILSGTPYDYDQHGYMIIVEPGDSIESLEERSCCFEMVIKNHKEFPNCSSSIP